MPTLSSTILEHRIRSLRRELCTHASAGAARPSMGTGTPLAAPSSGSFLGHGSSYLSEDDDDAAGLRLPAGGQQRRAPPRTILGTHGKYILGETLGTGATSVVRAGIHTDTLLLVAIKVLDLHRLRRHPGAVERVHSEVRILQEMAKNPHEHVILLRDLIRDEPKKRIYLVMEMVNGAPLQTLIQPEGQGDSGVGGARFPPSQVANIVAQVLSALEYVHGRGFVHRDVKPANLLLSSAGDVKLSDFGVSETLDRYDEGDNVSITSGTPAFQAPEIADGKAMYSGTKVDVWALGVSAFYMLSGRLPFNAKTHMELYQNIGKGHYQFPDDLKPDLPVDAIDAIDKMLQVDFKDRWSVAQLLHHPWVKSGDRKVPEDEQKKLGWLCIPAKTVDVLGLASRYMEAEASEVSSPVAGASSSSASIGAPSISNSNLFSPPVPDAGAQSSRPSFASGLYERPEDPIITPSTSDSNSSAAGTEPVVSSKLDLLDEPVVHNADSQRAQGFATGSLWPGTKAGSSVVAPGAHGHVLPLAGAVLQRDENDSSDDEFMAGVASGLAEQEAARWSGFASPEVVQPQSADLPPGATGAAENTLPSSANGYVPPLPVPLSAGATEAEVWQNVRPSPPVPDIEVTGDPASSTVPAIVSPTLGCLSALRDASLELPPIPGTIYDTSRTTNVASPVFPAPRPQMRLPGPTANGGTGEVLFGGPADEAEDDADGAEHGDTANAVPSAPQPSGEEGAGRRGCAIM